MLNRVPLSPELREESPLHSSSQWSPRIVLPPRSPDPSPGIFKLPIDEWPTRLSLGGWGGGRGEANGWEVVVRWDVWFTFKTSPRSRPVVRSKATLMQQKLPFSNTYIRFPCKLSEIFFGGESFPPGVFRYLPTSSPLSFFWCCWFGSVCV